MASSFEQEYPLRVTCGVAPGARRTGSREKGGRALVLQPFTAAHAAQIAQWVRTEQELHWVAPSTSWPLTPAKVTGWLRPSGRAFVLAAEHSSIPLGYGELNPMRRSPGDLWLGHVIVRADQRGEGLGLALVRGLLVQAFDRMAARSALLIVFPDNTAAIRCYRRAGFKVTGEEVHRFTESGGYERLLRLEARSAR